ncbi:MAG: hypothetical protein HC899_02945 [Leptolyngbyaceae cyanobacterium SM1_4_3]|nr:hypothetical protein [Leptolyngbyaceae cyanobacterium SM1_4_3]NJO66210.1 hypothetical protein [Leptolyngbyaceae cyanobacterium RM1_405_57]
MRDGVEPCWSKLCRFPSVLTQAIAMQTRGLSPLFLREVRQSSEKCVSPVCLVPAPRASYSGVAA